MLGACCSFRNWCPLPTDLTQIAMLYLEDDDTVNAEMFIKKASSLISNNKDEALELQYKVCCKQSTTIPSKVGRHAQN